MSGGNFSRRFNAHVLEYARLLRERRAPRLADFLAREPDDPGHAFLSSLIAEDFSIRASRGERPCVSDYFEVDQLADARPAVCRALNDLLFGDEALARAVGVDRFGEYRTTGIVGFGGFATVFSAVGPDDRRRAAAVKVCHPSVPGGAPMLRNEAVVLRKLDGRGGAPKLLADVSDEGGYACFAMERIAGQSLSSWLGVGSRSKPSMHARVTVCNRLAGALQAVHSEIVVHGDLSPDNIIVCEDDRGLDVRLIDYAQSYDGWRWNEHCPVFTVPYAAPELLAGGSPATYRSDVWSLAVVLFEVLTGERPFGEFKARQPIGQWLENIRVQRVRLPLEFGDPLGAVLHDAMSPSPGSRCPIHLIQSSLLQLHDPGQMASILRLGVLPSHRAVDPPAVRTPPEAVGPATTSNAEPVQQRPPAPGQPTGVRPARRPFGARIAPAATVLFAIALGMVVVSSRSSWQRQGSQSMPGASSRPSPDRTNRGGVTRQATTDFAKLAGDEDRSADTSWTFDEDERDFARARKLNDEANDARIAEQVRAKASNELLTLYDKCGRDTRSPHAADWLAFRCSALNLVGGLALKENRFDDAERFFKELLGCDANVPRWRAVALRRLGDAWLGREIDRRNDPTARAEAMNEAICNLRAASKAYRDPAVGDKDAAAEAELWIKYCQKSDFGQSGN